MKHAESRSGQASFPFVPKIIKSHEDLDQESMDALTASVLESASRAREDVVAFFEFVMRDITGSIQGPLTMAPHQKVGLDFIVSHDRCVCLWPVGFSKTFCAAGLTLFMLGRDPEMRGAVISATEGQAAKIITIVRDYIVGSPELKLVFPHLAPSRRAGDPWSQTAITVERRAGIKDNSLTAYSVESPGILGARLSWIIVDDVLSEENTATQEQREKVIRLVDSNVLSRLDPPPKGRVVMINTPWHPQDIVHHARDQYGWAAMRMDIYGDIEVWDDAQVDHPFIGDSVPNPKFGKFWDHKLLRPGDQYNQTSSGGSICRLTEHDPDPQNKQLLWPEFRNWEFVEKHKREKLPITFNQMYRCIVRDDASSLCKTEYIETCKRVARDMGIWSMVSEYRGPNLTFTGIDLAFAPGEERDETAFFTFEARPGGLNVILDIDVGQWPVPEILEKAFQKHERYGSFLMVENNGCFVPGTRVLTREHGYIPIEQVIVGDHVWTHKHRWRPVKDTIKAMEAGVTKAKAVGGIEVAATPTHWFHLREAARIPSRKGGHMRPLGHPQWISVGAVNLPSYVEVAVPTWPECEAKITLKKRGMERVHEVTEDDALAMGLYMAEGHAQKHAVTWTLASHEDHLADHIETFVKRVAPNVKVTREKFDGAMRVIAASTALARVFREFGKRNEKCPPLAWMGWPAHLRLALVRGWLLGDGCLLTNNAKTKWPSTFFSGSTISRNWAMWARSTLLEAGHRVTIKPYKPRKPKVLKGHIVKSGPGFVLSLNGEDSAHLRAEMTSEAEAIHWRPLRWSGRASNSQTVIDETGVWSRLKAAKKLTKHCADVYNLIVEEDESYTVEDIIVHNGMEMFSQFALRQNRSLPVKTYNTQQYTKVNPTLGIPAIFVELMNGAWVIPNTQRGEIHPMVKKWIDACLYYVPDKHTFDVLMASFLARELKRQFVGLGGDPGTPGGNGGGGIGMSIMSR